MLGVLLARCGTPVSADALADALWPAGVQDRVSQKLHVQVSRLRSMVGDRDRLRYEQGAYRLRVLPDELDAARFLMLVAEAADADPARCVELTRKALTLWCGDPYGGIDTPMVADDVIRLREHRLAALELLYRCELILGRHAAVLAEIAEFAAAHPLHEPAHWLFMTALYRNGRRAEASAAYRAVRRRLADELAIGPGPELRELARRMVAEEPVVLAIA